MPDNFSCSSIDPSPAPTGIFFIEPASLAGNFLDVSDGPALGILDTVLLKALLEEICLTMWEWRNSFNLFSASFVCQSDEVHPVLHSSVSAFHK